MRRLLPCGPRRRALGTDGVMVIVGGVVSVDVPAAARAVGRPATAAWRLAVSQLHPPACAYAHVEKGSLRAGPLRPCSRTDGRASPRSAGVVHRLPSVVRAGSGIQLCRVVLGCRGWACRQVESASISTRCPESVQAFSVSSQSGLVCQSRRATSGISGAVIGRRGAATPRLLLASPIRAGGWGRRCRRCR
jgi:hypothetical protein